MFFHSLNCSYIQNFKKTLFFYKKYALYQVFYDTFIQIWSRHKNDKKFRMSGNTPVKINQLIKDWHIPIKNPFKSKHRQKLHCIDRVMQKKITGLHNSILYILYVQKKYIYQFIPSKLEYNIANLLKTCVNINFDVSLQRQQKS